MRDRTGVCSETGELFLLTELANSAVSGLLVNAALLHRSANSNRRALRRELVQCQETQKWLLPDEVGICSVTRLNVDKRLLTPHGRTRKPVLSRLMQRCDATGTMVQTTELRRCALTRQMVLPDELERCALTGLRVSAASLNSHGQIAHLARLLDGDARNSRAADHLLPTLQPLDEVFRKAEHAWAIESPNGQTWAVCVELRPKLFERRTRYIGFILRMADQPEILGDGIRGYREQGAFVIEDTLEFTGPE